MRMLAVLVAVLGVSMALATESRGQVQAPQPRGQRPPPGAQAPMPGREKEKVIHGQVKNIDPSLAAITLTDGTRLVAPPGKLISPGLVTEGAIVIASYREEGGAKILTELAVPTPPSASPSSEPRSPGAAPPTAPPRDRPKR
jgi:hypothetical protein